MKKELKTMLNASQNMSLRINGAFTLTVSCMNAQGINIDLSTDKEIAERVLSIEYSIPHDKALFTSRILPSTSIEELRQDILIAMSDIMNEIALKLIQEFKNGQLLGEPEVV